MKQPDVRTEPCATALGIQRRESKDMSSDDREEMIVHILHRLATLDRDQLLIFETYLLGIEGHSGQHEEDLQ